MYLAELEIKDTTQSTTSASYLNLLLLIRRDGQIHTSIYDKRDDFNFHITNFPFLSNIPSSPAFCVFISQLIRYARSCSLYEWFMLSSRRHFSKLLKQGYLVNSLKSPVRKFYGRYGDLIQQYEVSLSRMLNDIPTLDQQLLPNRSDFPPILWPSLTFTKLWVVSKDHLQRVRHASRERLPFLVQSSFLGHACAPIVETRFLELVVSLLDFWLWIPLGTFSILLLIVILSSHGSVS